jgi:hypothetical protein
VQIAPGANEQNADTLAITTLLLLLSLLLCSLLVLAMLWQRTHQPKSKAGFLAKL